MPKGLTVNLIDDNMDWHLYQFSPATFDPLACLDTWTKRVGPTTIPCIQRLDVVLPTGLLDGYGSPTDRDAQEYGFAATYRFDLRDNKTKIALCVHDYVRNSKDISKFFHTLTEKRKGAKLDGTDLISVAKFVGEHSKEHGGAYETIVQHEEWDWSECFDMHGDSVRRNRMMSEARRRGEPRPAFGFSAPRSTGGSKFRLEDQATIEHVKEYRKDQAFIARIMATQMEQYLAQQPELQYQLKPFDVEAERKKAKNKNKNRNRKLKLKAEKANTDGAEGEELEYEEGDVEKDHNISTGPGPSRSKKRRSKKNKGKGATSEEIDVANLPERKHIRDSIAKNKKINSNVVTEEEVDEEMVKLNAMLSNLNSGPGGKKYGFFGPSRTISYDQILGPVSLP
ncbi:hypothetical protein EJ08DRAFT_699480 [Tothia fuscella]|uniref:Uncharacterized protein n=1 Tax=Tothia fuscella TaxID=1048955 RepID=A0A9P4NMY5_9PEZI|nr:hypothetical protein EJ08DRAFT_699480 [Tothia fuscella]